MLPKISVIVPVYNVEPYLEECLEHIIRQTYRNLEIILVDDGSTDNGGHICDEYAQRDSRVMVIHQANGGLSAARNTGMRAATGQYFGFIDSDDYPELDMYEKLMNLMTQYGAKMGMVSFFRTEGQRKKDAVTRKISRRELLMEIARGWITCCIWGNLYEAELWRGIEFPEGKTYEDIFTLYKIIDQLDFAAYTTEELYFYRDRPDSIMNLSFRASDLNLVESSMELEDYMSRAYPEAATEQRHTVTRNAAAILRKYLNANGDDQDTERFLLSAIRRDIPAYVASHYKLSSKLFACACAANFGMVKRLWPFLRKLQDA